MMSIKRVYEPPASSDGLRVLVDRIWPRGLTKDAAALDHWLKDIAPTTALRKWFGHDPVRWEEFRRKYLAELAKNPAVEEARYLTKTGRVTLLYAAHDIEHNQARVLADYLAKPSKRKIAKLRKNNNSRR
jgi:uncharacterized protein YeaO (DUF488 family)